MLPPNESQFTVTKKEFRQHLQWLKDSGFIVVSMARALELLERGKAKQGQYISLTFDDGLMDNWSVAWPILREFGFKAHFFLVSKLTGSSSSIIINGRRVLREYMGEDELKRGKMN
jgi:peptidoglycan/xylan/chitin deacetylase (PgdA/CDA1 family)